MSEMNVNGATSAAGTYTGYQDSTKTKADKTANKLFDDYYASKGKATQED